MAEEIPIGFQNYDPYNQGWYLLPVEAPLKVPYGISGLTSGQIDVLNSHTIQGLIELVYVRVGNDVLFSGLEGLDNALDVTTNTLQILSAVQELHNALKTSSLGSFSAWFRFSEDYSSQDRYQSNYNSVASAFFGVPIFPDFVYSSAGATIDVGGGTQSYDDFAKKLAQVRSQLGEQVDALSALASGTADETDMNSLYNTTKQVLSDLPPIVGGGDGTIAWTAAKLWAMDFYGAYDGQDFAQKKATNVIITYSHVPDPFKDVSLRPGRQLGMGTGYIQADGGDVALNPGGEQIPSIRIVSHDQTMAAATAFSAAFGGVVPVGTLVLTFSGRLAIGFESGTSVPTMIMINPVNSSAEVANPLKSVAGGDGEPYIGSFGGVTRGQAQNAGLFEQNITLAMTAAQGLNNTQTEEVRAFLFTFEEYYKSASSLLSSITQLIQKYAQGIRPA